MIEFHPITLTDKELIESYTMRSHIRNCDLSFANMYCWQSIMQSAWALVDGYLVIRFRIDGGDRFGYMLPISEDGSLDFSEIIPQIAADAHSHGHRLHIIGVTHESGKALKAAHQGTFALFSDPSNEDYIYLRERLTTLSGKRLQPKRNHINQFRKLYPNHQYRPLTSDLFEACMDLDCRWRAAHGFACDEKMAERLAMSRAFDNFEVLGMRGGALFVDDRLVAFTYGSAINHDTFCIHIEKGDQETTGCYTVINQMFAQSLPDNYTYLNREEDMGIEGLRRAKLSYYPTFKQEKFSAIYLNYDETECKRLWQQVFGDDDTFVDEFLMNHYSSNTMLRMIDNQNRYLSMLHIIPFNSEIGRVAYIYGVATDSEHRSKGYASELLRSAIEQIKHNDYSAIMLIPSSESLIGYYAAFGFVDGAMVRFSAHNNFDFGNDDPSSNHSMIYPIAADIDTSITELLLTK